MSRLMASQIMTADKFPSELRHQVIVATNNIW